jgi:hypothetical protein
VLRCVLRVGCYVSGVALCVACVLRCVLCCVFDVLFRMAHELPPENDVGAIFFLISLLKNEKLKTKNRCHFRYEVLGLFRTSEECGPGVMARALSRCTILKSRWAHIGDFFFFFFFLKIIKK